MNSTRGEEPLAKEEMNRKKKDLPGLESIRRSTQCVAVREAGASP